MDHRAPHPSVAERLARLAPDQRAAATAPSGPSLCIAPAGSGKTTTLVTRATWLIDTGTPPQTIRAITFNKRAAVEMTGRLDAAVAQLGVAPGTVRVSTFHALGREILRDAGEYVDPLADRPKILKTVAPWADQAALLRLDTMISRLKVELGVTAATVAVDPEAGPYARAFVEYEAALRACGGLDFDDLILRAIERLESAPAFLARWRARCGELLVDEVQDVDRAQLRLALLLAAPANRIFLVGDDDQSIYGWRLADVRRVLGLAENLPGLRRVDLEVNYRCPRSVVDRAVRLVEHNGERFVKRIRAGPDASGRLVLAPDPADETVRLEHAVRSWPDDGSTRAVLARTNRELLPAVVVAIRLGLPFRAPRIDLLIDSPQVDVLLKVADRSPAGEPLLVTLGRVRDSVVRGQDDGAGGDASAREDARDVTVSDPPGAGHLASGREMAGPVHGASVRDIDGGEPDGTATVGELATAMLGWAVGFGDLADLRAAIDRTRARLAELRRDDAPLTLATAHATKGLEFDHVVVVGMEAGRFPSERAVSEAEDPVRAYEEERRLAYVAWTRARRSLTLLYDPAIPSPFLLEAFTHDELGLDATMPR